MLRNRIIVGVALAAMLGSGIAATVSDSQARESVEGPVTAQIVRTVPLEDVAKLDKPKPVAVSKVEAPATPAAPVTAPVVTPPVSVVSAPVSVPVAPAVVSAKLTPAAPVVSAVAPPVVESAKPVAPVCEEDQPCFDCKTMGNKICGPAAPIVVTPVPIRFTAPDANNSLGEPVRPYPVQPDGVVIDTMDSPNQMSNAGWVTIYRIDKPGYVFPNGQQMMTLAYKPVAPSAKCDAVRADGSRICP